MSEKRELSKIEKRRLERDKRLNALKTKDGGKKQIQTTSRLGRIMFPVISVLIVVALLLWLAFATGFAQGMLNPMVVGSEKISMKEFTYYYKSTLNTYQNFVSYGLAPADALGRLDLNALCTMPGYEGKIWKDYVLDQTAEQVKETKVISTIASEKGFTFNEEDQVIFDEQMARLKETYPTDSELNKVLIDNYGAGIDLAYFQEKMKTQIVNERFFKEYPKSYNISADEIRGYYEENKNTMDLVTYRQFVFELPKSETELTEEEKKAAQENNKIKAEEMLEKISDAESFKEQALACAAEDQKSNYESGDVTLHEEVTANYTSSVIEVQTWLFDSERKIGDKAHLSNGTNEYILLFEGRKLLDNNMPNVYHILIGDAAAQKNPDEAQLEKDKVVAEELAAKIKTRADIETEGAAMRAAGTTREATLIENIGWKTMDPAFDKWIFDSSRQEGDVGVVKTVYGYHVVYYIGQSDQQEWEFKSISALRDKKLSEDKAAWLEEERFNIDKSNFALRYVN